MAQAPSIKRGRTGKPDPAHKKSKLPSVKNQIRSTHRLLKKGTLDARARVKLEQRLQELQATLEDHQRVAREKKLARRYHKVRFFERRKLLRRLRALQAAIADAGGTPSPQQATQLRSLNADLQYVTHFPAGEKYVSLLIDAESPEAREVQQRERARLRALVKAQQAERALLQEADEGLPAGQGADTMAAASLDEHDDGMSGSDEDASDDGNGDDHDSSGKVVEKLRHEPRKHGGALSSQHSGGQAKEGSMGSASRAAHPAGAKPSAQQPAAVAVDPPRLRQASPAEAFDDEFFLPSDDEGAGHAPLPPLTLPRQDVERVGGGGRGKGAGRGRGEGRRPPPGRGQRVGGRGQRVSGRGDRVAGRGRGAALGKAPGIAARPAPPAAAKVGGSAEGSAPTRTRAEGGRKRRKKA